MKHPCFVNINLIVKNIQHGCSIIPLKINTYYDEIKEGRFR